MSATSKVINSISGCSYIFFTLCPSYCKFYGPGGCRIRLLNMGTLYMRPGQNARKFYSDFHIPRGAAPNGHRFCV